MAEQDNQNTPEKPPKMKLPARNGNGHANGEPEPIDDGSEDQTSELVRPDLTTRVDVPEAAEPPVKPIVQSKSETARIRLSEAKPPTSKITGTEVDTARVGVPGSVEKPDTMRIDLAAAKVAGETGPVVHPGQPETQPIATDVTDLEVSPDDPTRALPELSDEEREAILKRSTIRVELDEERERMQQAGTAELDAAEIPAQPPAEEFSPDATTVSRSLTPEEREEVLKRSTMRVELTDTGPIDAPAPDAIRKPAMRVEVEDGETETPQAKPKADTARIQPPAMAGDDMASPSTRIEIADPDPGADVFKRHTGAVAGGAAGAAAAPAGKKPKRPATVVLKKPPATPAPPATGDASETPPVPEEGEKKSQTARIDAPPEVLAPAAGRPKTIKIKRAESTATRVGGAAKPEVKRSPAAKDETQVGAVYSVIALLSVIVILVLLYVLAAQTIAPTLPFAGRIPV